MGLDITYYENMKLTEDKGAFDEHGAKQALIDFILENSNEET